MRFVALLIVVAIIYLVLTHHKGPSGSVSDAMKEANAVTQPAAASTTATPAASAQPAQQSQTTSLRAPIDRTRQVLGQVKQRNGGGEF